MEILSSKRIDGEDGGEREREREGTERDWKEMVKREGGGGGGRDKMKY